MLLGSVVIITNAETGWVELSCKKFMPRVQPLLANLKILSARSTYEALFPDSPSDWKANAFYAELVGQTGAPLSPVGKQSGPGFNRNVISLGDSNHERLAIHRVTYHLGPSVRTKSIKFIERPTVEQLKRQVDLVTSCFEEICDHDSSLDLMLSVQLLTN